MPKYETKVLVLHDGGSFPIGSTIELSEKQAGPLLESGAIRAIAPSPEERNRLGRLCRFRAQREFNMRGRQLKQGEIVEMKMADALNWPFELIEELDRAAAEAVAQPPMPPPLKSGQGDKAKR